MKNLRETLFLLGKQISSIRNISFLLFALCSIVIHAQDVFTIKGKVTDANKEPIIGATVQDIARKTGVITDVDGNFTIQVTSKESILKIDYIGMESQMITTNGESVLNIVLKEKAINIDEVVVTALGIKREAKALGYAVSSVNSETLTAGNEQNVMSAISGKVAGVDISSTTAGPSGSTRVIIRGNSQLSGSNQPLYVIDGMPVDNTELEGANEWGGYDYGDVLSSINPEDIENISILKGPSASALYGSRASNGVVLITTKSASKKKGIGVEFSSNIDIVKILTGFDDYQRVYGQGRNGQPPMDKATASSTTQAAWGAKLDPNLDALIYNGETRKYGNVNNNILSFFKTGTTITNSVAFSKSNDATSFRMSIADMRNWDIIPESDLNRTSIMLKGTAQITKRFSIEGQATYTYEKVNNRPSLSDSPSNIGNSLIGIAPNFDQAWLASNYKDEAGRYNDWNSSIYRLNPYWVINEMSNESKRDRIIGQGKANYKITDYLSASIKAGIDTYTFKFQEYTPPYTPNVVEGAMMKRINDVKQYNFEYLLRFQKKFADFDISAFAGGNVMRYEFESTYQNGKKQIIPGLKDITNYTTIETSHLLNRKAVRSWFGQASIGYKDFIYLDATIRNDISSTLNPNNRSYIYPSVSGSLIFSELFKHDKQLFTFGKLRASWAKVGGDTDPYQLSLLYGLKSYTVNGTSLGEVASTVVPNADLKPTSTNSFEVGLDIRFFNNRLGLDMTVYKQSTKDQILSLPVSSSTGYSKSMINAGEITNKGIEMSISATPVKSKNFNWQSTINFAKNINEVVKLHEEVKDYELSAARWANAFIYAQEGEAYGSIVGPKLKRTEKGEVIYKDGLPIVEEELSILGNGNYDFTLGFNNVLTWNNFTFSALVDMKFGADVYSMSMMTACQNGTSKRTLEGRKEYYAAQESQNNTSSTSTLTGGYLGKGVKVVTDANGNETYVPNDVYVNPQTYWTTLAESTPEPFIYDNSYIKLREVALSYTFPKRWTNKTPIESITMKAYGRNLLILYSNLDNIDPESSYNSSNGQGLEYGSLPSRRSFGFGINVKF